MHTRSKNVRVRRGAEVIRTKRENYDGNILLNLNIPFGMSDRLNKNMFRFNRTSRFSFLASRHSHVMFRGEFNKNLFGEAESPGVFFFKLKRICSRE